MKNLSRIGFYVLIIMILAKIIGLAKESILAYAFGASHIVDAYQIAITVPATIFSIVLSGISNAFIPVCMRKFDNRKKFVSNLVTINFILGIIVMALCILFSDEIVKILAPGFSGEALELTQRFVTIISLSLPIMAVYNILMAYMQALELFIIINICNSIILNLIILGSIVAARFIDQDLLIWGYTFSQFIPMLVIYYFLKKRDKYSYKLTFEMNTEVKELVKLAAPLGLSVAVNQCNVLVNGMVASLIGTGIIASLNYANKIQLLLFTLITTTFVSICYPRINMHFANNDKPKGMYYITKSIMIISMIGIPMAILLAIFAKEIVSILFFRGAFDETALIVTANCLIFFAIGIPFYSYREILSRALGANKEQKKIMKNALITVGANIIFSITTYKILGYSALAIGTSLAGILGFILMYRDVLKMKVQILNLSEKKEIILICVTSITLGVLIYFLKNTIDDFISSEITFVLLSVVYGVLLLGTLFVLKANSLFWMINKMLGYIKK